MYIVAWLEEYFSSLYIVQISHLRILQPRSRRAQVGQVDPDVYDPQAGFCSMVHLSPVTQAH